MIPNQNRSNPLLSPSASTIRVSPMGIEHSGKQVLNGLSKKKRQRKQKKLTSIQRLYETCVEVFADCAPHIVPPRKKLLQLAAVLDGITRSDVGLQPNMPFFSSEATPTISYMHLFECDKFSIGIFCLPPDSVIPLHNHPGMTVFSKLLFGTIHIKSYDWFTEKDCKPGSEFTYPKGHQPGTKLAKLKVNSEFTAPCTPSILYPADGGNMHCFVAKTACALLDVLGPPYSDPDGRHCQYFHEIPFSGFDGGGEGEEEKDEYTWLEEREKPEDLSVVGVAYKGPRISISTNTVC